jgi:hypothetical protein
MGKQNHEEELIVVELEDLLEGDEVTDPEIPLAMPPPPPKGEFEGWTEGEEDLT